MILDRPSRYAEKFEDENDAIEAFSYLLNKLAELFGEIEFAKLKRSCLLGSTDYPEDFVHNVRAAKDLDDILLTICNPVYCNWLNIRLLKRIVRQTNINEAKRLIQAFEECMYAKKVTDMMPYFKSDYFDPKHVRSVRIYINKNANLLFVKDVVKYCQNLEGDMDVPEGIFSAFGCTISCLLIECVIPLQYSFYVYKMAKKICYRFRQLHIQYLEVEHYPKVYAMDVDESGDEILSAMSTPEKCMHV